MYIIQCIVQFCDYNRQQCMLNLLLIGWVTCDVSSCMVATGSCKKHMYTPLLII